MTRPPTSRNAATGSPGRRRAEDGGIGPERLRRLPLFDGLPEETIGRLHASARIERLRPGRTLFHEGDQGTDLYILVTGIIELTRIEGRRESGVLILSTGDLVMPAASVFEEPFLVSARALTAVRLLALDAARIREEAARTPDLSLRLARIIGGQWRMAVRHILDLKCRSAAERLGALLLRIVDDGPLAESADLPIPKRCLAARVGMTAETLSRTLQTLADNGLHLRGSRILVRDRARIERFCGADPYPLPTEPNLGVNVI